MREEAFDVIPVSWPDQTDECDPSADPRRSAEVRPVILARSPRCLVWSPCLATVLPNCAVLDQGGALRAPRAGACARPLPWEARPSARRPHRQDAADQQAHPATHPKAKWGAVFLGDSWSRSRPACRGQRVRVGLRTAPRSTHAGLRPIAPADRGMARLDVPVAQVTSIRPGRRGVRPDLRRVHPQAPGHPARCLTRGNEGGFSAHTRRLAESSGRPRSALGSAPVQRGKSSCRHEAKTVASTVPLARIRI